MTGRHPPRRGRHPLGALALALAVAASGCPDRPARETAREPERPPEPAPAAEPSSPALAEPEAEPPDTYIWEERSATPTSLAGRMRRLMDLTKGPAENGEILFRELKCQACHKLRGLGGDNAPELQGVGAKYARLKGSKEAARAWFTAHIDDPDRYPGVEKARFPSVVMPQFGLAPDQVDALAHYLSTLE